MRDSYDERDITGAASEDIRLYNEREVPFCEEMDSDLSAAEDGNTIELLRTFPHPFFILQAASNLLCNMPFPIVESPLPSEGEMQVKAPLTAELLSIHTIIQHLHHIRQIVQISFLSVWITRDFRVRPVYGSRSC